MLSFKGLASFFKRGGPEGGASNGVGNNSNGNNGGYSGSASGACDGVNNTKNNLSNRAGTPGFPGAYGCKRGDDVNNSFIESPLFGMPSAFGDNSMFASSSILKGLRPNASTQDVLRHIQGVVQKRSDQLQRQDDATAAAAGDVYNGEVTESLSYIGPRNSIAATRDSLEGDSPRSSHSLIPTAVPPPMSVSPTNTNGTCKGVSFTIPASASRAKLLSLQKIRAEMIDALDVCLQEVPEGVAQSALADEEKARLDMEAGGAAGWNNNKNADGRSTQECVTRGSSVVPPSSFTGGPSGSLDGIGGTADTPTNWGDENNNTSLDGTRTNIAAATSRNASMIATPAETADLSTVAAPGLDTSASSPPPSVPTVFTHYEWRCLLLQIVEVIVRIDRTLMDDVRHRAMEKLATGVAVPISTTSPVGSTTEFRWQRLSQVLPAATDRGTTTMTATAPSVSSATTAKAVPSSLTPTNQSQQVDVAGAPAPLNSPHLTTSRSEALMRTPDDTELPTLPVPAAPKTTASGQAASRESQFPLSGWNTTTTATSGTAAAGFASLPPPVAKVKHALEENGVLPPANRVDYSISKEDKKLLEELLMVACSLATWAIIKAILRHHLQVLSSSRQCNSRKANCGAGADAAAATGLNAPTRSAERATLEVSLTTTTTTETGTTGKIVAGASAGRPPLAPLPLPPPAPSVVTSGSADEPANDVGQAQQLDSKKVANNASDSALSDDIPYIDWESVVQELDEWMGNSPGHIVAECTLCASFLRDDGREMVMCMLQKPKPRYLLSNIHRHAERLRHTDPTAATAAAASTTTAPVAPMASPRGGISTTGSSSNSVGTSNGTAAPSATTASQSTMTNPTSAGSGGGSAAAAAVVPSAAATASTISTTAASGGGTAASNIASSGAPPSPTLAKLNPSFPSSVQVMMDDPTLVMDDLVAELELVYRKAVGDTWSSFLEGAVEAEMASVQLTLNYGNSSGLPISASEATITDKSGNDGEEKMSAVPQAGGSNNNNANNGSNFTDEPLPGQSSATSTQLTPSAPESPLTRAYITDTKTLCRLATAYFFGSDAWSERKRERRFAVLYRSMRTRMERYSESAATRRNIRRGNSSAASPTQTATTTAVASPVEVNPLSELAIPSTAQQPQKTPRASFSATTATTTMTAGTTILVPPTPNARASPSQNSAAAVGGTAFTPTKFSVEDMSPRSAGTGAAPASAAAAMNATPSNTSSFLPQVLPSTTLTAGSLPRHGLLNTQFVAHQLLSSNASNAAASNHSTPLAGSFQMSRECGVSDVEATSAATGRIPNNGSNNGNHLRPNNHLSGNGTDRYSLSTAEQSAAWTPFGFVSTPPDTTTTSPEAEQMSNTQHQNLHLQQQAASIGVTPPRSECDSNTHSFAAGGSSTALPTLFGTGVSGGDNAITTATLPTNTTMLLPPPPPPSSIPSTYSVGCPLSVIVLERIVNMSWSAALHKRGEQCLSAKPPRLEEAEQNAQEERLVAGAFGEFRARQRSLVSLINARLAAGKSVEALSNAQKHFRFEKKDWTSHSQTIFSALRYLQSMVLLVRAQAACRVYGAVIETVQFVLPQATLCEQMLQVLAPRPRRDCVIRFADCRSKLLRSNVYLLKECWLAHAAFNDHAKAAKYFSQCAQVLQMLRRRSRESELFAAYMERGSQLMKMKDYKKSVELFQLAVNIAKKSLKDADAAAAGAAGGTSASTSAVPSLGSTTTNGASAVPAASSGFNVKSGGNSGTTSAQQQFHRNMHFRGAGSGLLYTAEEHSVGTSAATADDLEFAWRVAESERMLALSYVTQAEHEVNVRERREELSNAVSNAYSSQRSLQRWQTKGGTPKRLLTAVPCSLIVICKGLLLLNQARKAALLLEPLIENKPNSALVRPPMWREILDPTEDPYTAEDVVLRTYVCSVKIAVYMLYARCLAEFDGERALRAVTQVDQLLQESDTWIYAIRTELRRALEEVLTNDKSATTAPTSPCTVCNLELPRITAPVMAARASTGPANDDNEDTMCTARQGGGGAETVVSVASTVATAGTRAPATDVPPLRVLSTGTKHMNTNSVSASNVTDGGVSHHSPEYNSPEEVALHQRRSNEIGGVTGGAGSVAPSRDDLLPDDDGERSRRSTVMNTGLGSINADMWNCGNPNAIGDLFPVPSSPMDNNNNLNSSSNQNSSTMPAGGSPQAVAAAATVTTTAMPTLRVHMESASECMTALFALREGKSHIRKALRDVFIVGGDAHSLIKNWEEALKSYSHALVISMSEVEAANAAAQSRRRVSHFTSPRNTTTGTMNNNSNNSGGVGAHDDTKSLTASQVPSNVTGVVNGSHHPTPGGPGSSLRGGGSGGGHAASTITVNNNGTSVMDTCGGGGAMAAAVCSNNQCWGQVVPLDEEFYLWDEEDGLIADNMVNRDLTASTAAKDLRAVVADEERMDSRACESLVLSKLANVYRALDKPTTAIHYHNLVLDYANECSDKLLAYNSMLSLARLYTAASLLDEARDTWAKVSDLAKEYEDKEVSRETKRNIVAGQESAGMYLDVVKTAEELEKLATCEEGEDAAADRRFALEALANANLQLGQYEACITALDNREKVQEKSAEWNGRLLSMRAKARMGLNKPAEAIKVMQSWASKARNLGNWVELGKANSALSAAYASENQNVQARHYHEATLNAFALAESLNEDCQQIALDSARWLVHYAYLDEGTVQVDPSLTYTGGCLTSDSEASVGDFRYTDSNLCNISGDLGAMLAKEEELRRSPSSLISESLRGRDGSDEDDFFSSSTLSNNSLFCMSYPNLAESDRPAHTPNPEDNEEMKGDGDNNNRIGRSDNNDSDASSSGGAAAGTADDTEKGIAAVSSDGEKQDESMLQRHVSNTFEPKDPNCATQPPSLVSSVDRLPHEYPAQPDTLELNFSCSSAGQSEVGDNDTLGEENEDEVRRRREVDEALRTMDDDVDHFESSPPMQLERGSRNSGSNSVGDSGAAAAAATVAAAVAAAAQSNMFFNVGEDEEVCDTKGVKASSSAVTDASFGGAKGAAKSATTGGTSNAAPPMPNVTTAAVKSTGSAAVTGGTKSASSNYIPPPTALANVSICSRPAAAAAGTDVLEMPVDGGWFASDSISGAAVSVTGSPLGGSNGGKVTNGGGAGFADGRDDTAVGGASFRQDGDDSHQVRKPARVRTTYYRGAIEMMETAAQLLLVPRSVSRMVIPYSPAEAVDFALLTHPRSLFVFYFAEYTTEYGAQCDVVVRPPCTTGFLKLRTQISLREYHNKDVVRSLLTTLSSEPLVEVDRASTSTTGGNNNNCDLGVSLTHPFGGAVAKASAATSVGSGGGSNGTGAGPTLSNFSPDLVRAVLDDESLCCLHNLHADAWQPIIDRMHREHVSYQGAETVIIMPDIALLHVPFAGLLPSPDYGGEDAPLGEQFTLIVTPSLAHFVYHGMSAHQQQHCVSPERCGALDPNAYRYLFIPYDTTNTGGMNYELSTGVAVPGSSAPGSPRLRQQQQASPSTKAAVTLISAANPSTTGATGRATNNASPVTFAALWPPVSPAHSNGDSTLPVQTSTTASTGNTDTAGPVRRESATLGAAESAITPTDDGTFDGLLKTWRVHRGCTRKELIHAFTDCQTRALMFLGPIDQGGVRVADGVVTLNDIMQKLQQARLQQAAQGGSIAICVANAESNNNNLASSGAAQALPAASASSAPSIPLPPLCTHMDLLVLTADRGICPSVTNGGMTANLCMSLGVHRVLRLNIIHDLAPNDEHHEFIAHYLTNLRKVMRWKLRNPYAVALRITIAEARAKGMSSNTWGAFTLIGSA